jgi:cytochrome c biogenesis protein CcdA
VGGWLPWLSLGTGVVLAIAGGRLLAGGSIEAPVAERLADRLGSAANRTGVLAYAAYGLAFALSSLGCTLPLFLVVIGTGIARGGIAGGLGQPVLYALGMGAVLLLTTGGYIVYYWLSAGGILG